VPGRRSLVSGSWGWVAPGCSVQSHRTHGRPGDWAAHYNRNPSGNNDGGYTPVCQNNYHYGEVASNVCPTQDVSEADCLAAAQSLQGVVPGRRSLVSGSWGWVAPGCSVQSHRTHGRAGDWAAHYNRNSGGNNDGGYTPVCMHECQHLHNQDVTAGTFEHYGLDYSNSPSDHHCSATCTANRECTAWVRQPSTGSCWISRQSVVTFEADRDRTTGLRCDA